MQARYVKGLFRSAQRAVIMPAGYRLWHILPKLVARELNALGRTAFAVLFGRSLLPVVASALRSARQNNVKEVHA